MRLYKNLPELQQAVSFQGLTLLLIKAENCSVCDALAEKLEVLLERYADVHGAAAYIEAVPEMAGQYLVMTAPIVLLFVEGKEVYRGSRFIRMGELEEQVVQWLDFISS